MSVVYLSSEELCSLLCSCEILESFHFYSLDPKTSNIRISDGIFAVGEYLNKYS